MSKRAQERWVRATTMTPAEAQEAARRHGRSRATAYVASLFLLATLIAIALIPVPYIKLSPGPMYNTIGSVDGVDLIQISGTQTYSTAGNLNLMTVTERGGPFGGLSLPEAYYGALNPDDRVVPVDALYPPGTTGDQARQENTAEFTSSQSAAISASLSYLKIPVTSTAVIANVAEDGPSQGKLEDGDVIRAVDGTTVAKPTEIAPLVRKQKPGTVIEFSILRDEKPLTVSVTSAANPDNPELGYVGISTSVVYKGPFPIEFGLDDVGGPSAGMMFSLGIIDKLTPGNLNGGKLVAGTGTMTADGNAGPIGGLAQKMAAARNAGVELFLVDADNCDDVIANPMPDLNVVKVSTLADAVNALNTWTSGGTDLPRCG